MRVWRSKGWILAQQKTQVLSFPATAGVTKHCQSLPVPGSCCRATALLSSCPEVLSVSPVSTQLSAAQGEGKVGVLHLNV